jgi:hypothetical protein
MKLKVALAGVALMFLIPGVVSAQGQRPPPYVKPLPPIKQLPPLQDYKPLPPIDQPPIYVPKKKEEESGYGHGHGSHGHKTTPDIHQDFGGPPPKKYGEEKKDEDVTMSWRFQSVSRVHLPIYFNIFDDFGGKWPPYGRSWVLKDTREYTVSIRCTPGETVCYGAWNDRGSEWGVGRYNNYHHSDYCRRCVNGETRPTRLGGR